MTFLGYFFQNSYFLQNSTKPQNEEKPKNKYIRVYTSRDTLRFSDSSNFGSLILLTLETEMVIQSSLLEIFPILCGTVLSFFGNALPFSSAFVSSRILGGATSTLFLTSCISSRRDCICFENLCSMVLSSRILGGATCVSFTCVSFSFILSMIFSVSFSAFLSSFNASRFRSFSSILSLCLVFSLRKSSSKNLTIEEKVHSTTALHP